MGSETRKRDMQIKIRVSQVEKETFTKKAQDNGMTIPAYLRELGLGHNVKGKLNQKSLLELLKVNADLGRLGGLLKIWLSDSDEYQKQSQSIGVLEITDLLNKIDARQSDIKKIAREL